MGWKSKDHFLLACSALVRPVPAPPAGDDSGGADAVPGYLHLLMPVRLPG